MTQKIGMPWTMVTTRVSILMKDGVTWNRERENMGNYYLVMADRWKETHPFTFKKNNIVANATIHVEEIERRPLWFRWTSLFAKKSKCIFVEFDSNIGNVCTYEMLPNETPLECLRRMENQVDFKSCTLTSL